MPRQVKKSPLLQSSIKEEPHIDVLLHKAQQKMAGLAAAQVNPSFPLYPAHSFTAPLLLPKTATSSPSKPRPLNPTPPYCPHHFRPPPFLPAPPSPPAPLIRRYTSRPSLLPHQRPLSLPLAPLPIPQLSTSSSPPLPPSATLSSPRLLRYDVRTPSRHNPLTRPLILIPHRQLDLDYHARFPSDRRVLDAEQRHGES